MLKLFDELRLRVLRKQPPRLRSFEKSRALWLREIFPRLRLRPRLLWRRLMLLRKLGLKLRLLRLRLKPLILIYRKLRTSWRRLRKPLTKAQLETLEIISELLRLRGTYLILKKVLYIVLIDVKSFLKKEMQLKKLVLILRI